MESRYPHRVCNYKGIDIWYNPVKKQYQASLCEDVKRDKSIDVVKKWIDGYKH